MLFGVSHYSLSCLGSGSNETARGSDQEGKVVGSVNRAKSASVNRELRELARICCGKISEEYHLPFFLCVFGVSLTWVVNLADSSSEKESCLTEEGG